ncbi:hypothetical protein BASA81_003692 [Batrachochytrium salamandrivorans]|nr:hypothetical protein BASA81_003692 [Batrachochytrium salamandrivorans]
MKSVQDFAAKQISVGDSQAEWQKWTNKGSSSNTKSNHLDPPTTQRKPQWTKLLEENGTPYWLDTVSGSKSLVEPNFVANDEDEEDEEDNVDEAEEQVVKYPIPSKPLERQKWQVLIHSLTRQPVWYCQEIEYHRNSPPPPEPYRAVRDQHQVYFWNPDTGETTM